MTSSKTNVSLLANIFIKRGLSDIVISPGSRNAPIVISFAGRDEIRALSVIDERSAAFFAMGMAQQLGKAVAIACTSGSAALNYAPAIAEAYYQKIPLLVLTADRPPELINHGDGQTIRQKDVYKNYIKKSFELPVVVDDPATFQIAEVVINRAIDETMFPEPGPVHINIPLREPLYGIVEDEPAGRALEHKEIAKAVEIEDLMAMEERWNESTKVMIIAGQMPYNSILNGRLKALAKLENVIVLSETTSNLFDKKFIDCIDNVISTISDDEIVEFQPDLLISIGGQVVSKMVKKFLRLNPPKDHWHISPSGEWIDTYFMLNKIIAVDPATFFKSIASELSLKNSHFAKTWQERKLLVGIKRLAYLQSAPYSDLKVIEALLDDIPTDGLLHLGNSTPVRYSQLFGALPKFQYHSNRGVSGIDGQVSTAAGAALISDKVNTIITGDLGFFYDSNALMNQHLTANLKIIVINNSGGGIFRFIPGPDTSVYLEEFFETKHNWKADKIAETFNITYFKAENIEELKVVLPHFYTDKTDQPALLEIFTPNEISGNVLKSYFKKIKTI